MALASFLPLHAAAQDADTTAPKKPAAKSAAELDRVEVTGTRIKGGATASPVITIGAETIQQEGFKDLGEVIRSIPQNFTGGQNPGVASLGYSGGGVNNQNITGGSGLNLRGLGPDATVTLLNGRRLAYSVIAQSVDISAIPVEAVERIDIVPDGASAIYGADAVGGVGNVILRRDFDGIALGTLYGTATDGGLATREYTATAGSVWASGGVLVTLKDASVDPIYAADRDYAARLIPPTTLYPGSDLRSALVTAHQGVGEVAEVRLDAFRTERSQLYNIFSTSGRNNHVMSDGTSTMVAPSVDAFLPGDWTLTAGAAFGRSGLEQVQTWETPGSEVRTRWLYDMYSNESRLYEVGAEGPVFAAGGGDARLALGVGYRENALTQVNRLTNVTSLRGDDDTRSAYAELQVPLVGAGQGVAFVDRLALNAAVRTEDHDSFGAVTVPKVGVIWAPGPDFTLRASWGKSFKAPTLFQRNRDRVAILERPAFWGGTGYPAQATVLSLSGGNPDLEAERALTRTATLAFHPDWNSRLTAELTWFNIDYTGRVAEPITITSQALTNPVFAPYVWYTPTSAEQAALLAEALRFTNRAGIPYDPANVVAIIRTQYINVARQEISGLDLSGAYRFDVGDGQLTLRGAVSWLDSTQQVSAGQPVYDLAGTLYNPPDVTGRLGAVWSSGGFTASSFVNYKGGVENRVAREHTTSFTTVDATLRYAPDAEGTPFAGMTFSLSAQNLFNRAPPLHTSFLPGYAPPYDSTNYSAIGRFLSVSVSKQW